MALYERRTWAGRHLLIDVGIVVLSVLLCTMAVKALYGDPITPSVLIPALLAGTLVAAVVAYRRR